MIEKMLIKRVELDYLILKANVADMRKVLVT